MAKSALYQEYMKERHRVQNFIRRTSKRGYQFKENALPKMPAKVSTRALERLKKLTPEKLYEKATYTTVDGKTISGTEARYQEKRLTAKKAGETRKFKNRFNIGNIILRRIREMIEQARTTKPKSAESLEDLLDEEINEYGEKAVCQNIANAPEDMIADAQIALTYNPGHPTHENAIKEMRQIITGEVMTMEEAMRQQDIIDDDELYEEV